LIQQATGQRLAGWASSLAFRFRRLHDTFPIPATGVRLLVLLVISAAFAVLSPYFLLPNNLLNVAVNVCVVGIIACPLTLLMVARQIDLSVGSAVSWCAVIFGLTFPHYGLQIAVLSTLLGALVIVSLNAFAVTVVGVNSLIVTLATMAIFRGAARLISGNQSVKINGFEFIGAERLFGFIPVPVLILLVVVIAYQFLMRYTVYGRHMYALGANPRASRLAGVKTRRNLILAFLLTSISVTLAAMIMVSLLASVPVDMGSGQELLAITGIILGGASLAGGRGTVIGTMSALLILAVLDNGMSLMNIYSFWQDVIRGSVLLGAVSFDQIRIRLDNLQDENE
jgi:ribose transport system permease protein